MRSDPARKTLRCAVYTRVSTDAGLDQEFNSLDNQREASEAYIKSQAHEGWKLLKDRYDDGGFSGGSMDRPALQGLLAAVRARQVDVIVVYKVDRLTRSLADFAKVVELFDADAVSFVSVTQAFNTTTSMGRLTLNVLLSFAQFEREVTSEQIRDKIAASKKKGIWMGGTVPLGYRVDNRKLLVEPTEAETVRMIFDRYLALKSLPALLVELRDKGILTRRRHYATGRVVGGIHLSKGPLAWMLKNRIYLGELLHKGQYHPGEHEPIISPDVFDAVQARLAINHHQWTKRREAQGSLLLGRIFDDRGNRMTPTYVVKGGVRYRYYVSCVVNQRRDDEAGSLRRVPAPDLEEFVLAQCRARLAVHNVGFTKPRAEDPDSTSFNVAASSHGRAQTGSGPDLQTEAANNATNVNLIQAIGKIVVSSEMVAISWLGDDGRAPTTEHAWRPPRRRPRRQVFGVASNDTDALRMRSDERERILANIARGRAWLDEMVQNSNLTIAALSKRARLHERTVRMTLNLAFLSPKIVSAAMAGTLAAGTGTVRLAEASMVWRRQEVELSHASLKHLPARNPG